MKSFNSDIHFTSPHLYTRLIQLGEWLPYKESVGSSSLSPSTSRSEGTSRLKSLHEVRFPVYGAGLHIKQQRSTCLGSSVFGKSAGLKNQTSSVQIGP